MKVDFIVFPWKGRSGESVTEISFLAPLEAEDGNKCFVQCSVPCQSVCSLSLSPLLLSSKKPPEMKFCSEILYHKSCRKNGAHCEQLQPPMTSPGAEGTFLLRFHEVSFGNVLGVTAFLPGSTGRATNPERSCGSGTCSAAWTAVGAAHCREQSGHWWKCACKLDVSAAPLWPHKSHSVWKHLYWILAI